MSVEPYRGLLTLRGAIQRLQELLPAEFEGLPRGFSCGVVSSEGQHVVLSSGSLPEVRMRPRNPPRVSRARRRRSGPGLPARARRPL